MLSARYFRALNYAPTSAYLIRTERGTSPLFLTLFPDVRTRTDFKIASITKKTSVSAHEAECTVPPSCEVGCINTFRAEFLNMFCSGGCAIELESLSCTTAPVSPISSSQGHCEMKTGRRTERFPWTTTLESIWKISPAVSVKCPASVSASCNHSQTSLEAVLFWRNSAINFH